MKYVFPFVVIFFLFSCKSSNRSDVSLDVSPSLIQRNTVIPVKIELNKNELSGFGIPVAIGSYSSLKYCLRQDEILRDTISNNKFTFEFTFPLIKFTYKKEEDIIRGQFILPEFPEIEYKKNYDAETMAVKLIRPMKVYNLVRTGKWEFLKEGKAKYRSYNIVIDDSQFSEFCK